MGNHKVANSYDICDWHFMYTLAVDNPLGAEGGARSEQQCKVLPSIRKQYMQGAYTQSASDSEHCKTPWVWQQCWFPKTPEVYNYQPPQFGPARFNPPLPQLTPTSAYLARRSTLAVLHKA